MPRLLKRLEKYPGVNTLDLLKALAVTAMIIDHGGFYLLGNSELWRSFGRLAAPLFFFIAGFVARPLSSETPPWRSPLLRLLPLGLILTLLDYIIFESVTLNILLNLLLIKLVLGSCDAASLNKPGVIALFVFLLFTNFLAAPFIEYGTLGLAYATGGRLLAENKHPYLARILIVVTVVLQFANYWPGKQHHVFFAALGILLVVILLGFRFRVLDGFREKFFVPSQILLILSRYSLEIYFLHLAALKLLYISWLLDY